MTYVYRCILLPLRMLSIHCYDFSSYNAGLELSVDSCKSLVLACALFDGHINSQQACELARLENRYQVNIYQLIPPSFPGLPPHWVHVNIRKSSVVFCTLISL